MNTASHTIVRTAATPCPALRKAKLRAIVGDMIYGREKYEARATWTEQAKALTTRPTLALDNLTNWGYAPRPNPRTGWQGTR